MCVLLDMYEERGIEKGIAHGEARGIEKGLSLIHIYMANFVNVICQFVITIERKSNEAKKEESL